MAREGFWSGFGFGALAGAAAGFCAYTAADQYGSSYNSRILRLERSIQIGRPVEEVFDAWSTFEGLPDRISILDRVESSGQHSNWAVEIDGQLFEFDAETVQLIPNEAIGWKSVTGPKHSGRINFARLGNDTLVHVSMNYAPPLGRFGRLLSPLTDHLESQIELALRDFKRSLEGGAQQTASSGEVVADRTQPGWRPGETASQAAVERWGRRPPASAGWDEPSSASNRTTGTGGVRTLNPSGTPGTHVEDREGKVQQPGAVDYTRPPKDRY
jgi:uncharacterized membrane protein